MLTMGFTSVTVHGISPTQLYNENSSVETWESLMGDWARLPECRRLSETWLCLVWSYGPHFSITGGTVRLQRKGIVALYHSTLIIIIITFISHKMQIQY